MLSHGSTSYHLKDFLGQNISTYLDPTIIHKITIFTIVFFLFFLGPLMMKRLKCSGRFLIFPINLILKKRDMSIEC